MISAAHSSSSVLLYIHGRPLECWRRYNISDSEGNTPTHDTATLKNMRYCGRDPILKAGADIDRSTEQHWLDPTPLDSRRDLPVSREASLIHTYSSCGTD